LKRLLYTSTFLFLAFLLLLDTGGCADKRQNSIFTIEQKQKLTIGSTGANLPILKKLADSYMEKNRKAIIEIPVSLSNDQAVRNVEEGNLDIGLTSLPLENNKIRYLHQKLFARTIVVIAVNPSVPISGLTKRQVTGIYSGELKNWYEVGGTESKIIVLSNMHGESTMMAIDKYIKGLMDIKGSAHTIMLKDSQVMNEAITSIQDSIGFSDIGAIKAGDLKIKPLAIQGITPTVESFESGNYRMAKNLYLITPYNPSELAKDFVDYVLGWEGKKVILDNGYLAP